MGQLAGYRGADWRAAVNGGGACGNAACAGASHGVRTDPIDAAARSSHIDRGLTAPLGSTKGSLREADLLPEVDDQVL